MNGAALVIGGQGGIGAALARLWTGSGLYTRVLITARKPADETAIPLDLADEASIGTAAGQAAARLAGEPLAALAICTGILHGRDIAPERRVGALEPEAFMTVMRINALGPLLVAKHFSSLLPRSSPSHLAAISARVGSIGDNRLGGWYSYRSSKAALNQGFRTLSVELRRTHPQCVLTLFHPGTVDTALSKPFQQGVAQDKLFAPDRAARQFDEVLRTRVDAEAPLFVDWRGEPVEF